MKLEFYNDEELQKIVERGAVILEEKIDVDASLQIAKCSRGTPRISLRLLKRVRDFSYLNKAPTINLEAVNNALKPYILMIRD